jgi:hypothetical protein
MMSTLEIGSAASAQIKAAERRSASSKRTPNCTTTHAETAWGIVGSNSLRAI